MQTKQQLKNKKEELEQWLRDNSTEHEARPMIESDLRRVNDQLAREEYAR